jgi:hypothetical protein
LGGTIFLSSKKEKPGTTILFKVATTTLENASTFHNDLFKTLNNKKENMQMYKNFILERFKFSSNTPMKFGQFMMPGKLRLLKNSNTSNDIISNDFLEKAILENYQQSHRNIHKSKSLLQQIRENGNSGAFPIKTNNQSSNGSI